MGPIPVRRRSFVTTVVFEDGLEDVHIVPVPRQKKPGCVDLKGVIIAVEVRFVGHAYNHIQIHVYVGDIWNEDQYLDGWGEEQLWGLPS